MFLEHRAEVEVAMLVAAKTHGATPLVVACRNGHYDVAEYLIQRCKANIEQPGSGMRVILCPAAPLLIFLLIKGIKLKQEKMT